MRNYSEEDFLLFQRFGRLIENACPVQVIELGEKTNNLARWTRQKRTTPDWTRQNYINLTRFCVILTEIVVWCIPCGVSVRLHRNLHLSAKRPLKIAIKFTN